MVRMNTAPYAATKHGLIGLTKSTALEGREHGISAGCLHPGNVDIERRPASDSPIDYEPTLRGLPAVPVPMMTPSDLAMAAVTMAALPPYVNMLESIVLPVKQQYLGRG